MDSAESICLIWGKLKSGLEGIHNDPETVGIHRAGWPQIRVIPLVGTLNVMAFDGHKVHMGIREQHIHAGGIIARLVKHIGSRIKRVNDNGFARICLSSL